MAVLGVVFSPPGGSTWQGTALRWSCERGSIFGSACYQGCGFWVRGHNDEILGVGSATREVSLFGNFFDNFYSKGVRWGTRGGITCAIMGQGPDTTCGLYHNVACATFRVVG